MAKGYLAIVLHSHLPYVRHPEYNYFLEENWYFEALTETYLPLLDMFQRLLNDGVPFRLTVGLTPTLLAMFSDPFLSERYVHHLDNLLELAGKEVERTRWQPEFHRLARMYQNRFGRARYLFDQVYHRNLVEAFARLERSGQIELITSAATHGYLPLLDYNPAAVRAQIKIGVEEHKRHFGRQPAGFWLPECAFLPGHDAYLAECGVRYFLTDAHGLYFATPRPRYANFAPVFTPNGVAAFGRDLESSKQVWSATEGYPGDYEYRDFYRDIGFDLDLDYLRPHLTPEGQRIHTGFKYYRITGPSLEYKEPYDPDRAREKAALHAGNFMFNREKQVEYLASFMDRKPVIVAPYDAELFGHWWFEGPLWLEFLLRKIAYDQETIKTVTLSDYLAEYPRNQVAMPAQSSWGWKGYHEVWLNGANDWTYRHLHKAAERLAELVERFPEPDPWQQRALRQAARELLLAQASDWSFIMKTGTTVQYAVRRFKDHLGRFTRLYEDLLAGRLDEGWLSEVEGRDNLFPDLDVKVFRSAPAAHRAVVPAGQA
ncbi:MAG: glycoside hydrolase family 57 protein [Betaproteobacteria bacterium]